MRTATAPPDTRSARPSEAALAYAARGWSVLPIVPREKRPLIAWTELQDRHAGAEEIRAWFERWPTANVGIVTGRISGLVVLDVDPRHGGADSLAGFERANGPLPPTIEAVTGQGGRHLYFRYPGRRLANRVGLLPGIDLRGDGGMIVAPPSVHPSGGLYAWKPGQSPEEATLASIPPAMWRLIRAAGTPGGHPPEHWRALAAGGVEEGARNNTIASLAGHLLWHGIDPEVARELLLGWNRLRCRPPLDDAEVDRVVRSIAALHEQERGHEG